MAVDVWILLCHKLPEHSLVQSIHLINYARLEFVLFVYGWFLYLSNIQLFVNKAMIF